MEDFYNILGVNENSSTAEIKKAYARLIRINSPEKEPEKFKTIRQAYEILENEESRKEYDVNLKYGDELKDLVDEALEFMKNENYKEASINLKKVLLIKPDTGFLIYLLGLCYLRTENYYDAISEFLKAIEIDDTNALYYSGCAYSYYLIEEYDKAIEYYNKAIEIQPLNKEIYLKCARVYMKLDDYKSAAEILIDGINAGDEIVADDFELYLFLLDVYTIDESLENYEGLKNEIVSIIPQDEEVKKYAISRLTNKILFYKKYKYYNACCFVADILCEIDPYDDELKNIKKTVYQDKKINRELSMLKRNSIFIKELYRCLVFQERGYIKIEDEAERKKAWEKLYNILIEKIKTSNPINVSLIKSNYPAIYERYSEFIDYLGKISVPKNENKDVVPINDAVVKKETPVAANFDNSSNTYETKDNSSGGCLILIIFTVIGAAIGGPAGAIFGLAIGAFIVAKM